MRLFRHREEASWLTMDLLIPSKYEMLFREPIVFSPDRLKTAWDI
jgi:hypothetical protein